MADAGRIGTVWSDEELDAIVADYFAMLELEATGRPYVKAHHSAALMARIGRTHRSVEFKHMNISAVLSELALPTIRGYRPKPNVQEAIFDAVERYLAAHGRVFEMPQLMAQQRAQGLAAPLTLFEAEPPARLNRPRHPRLQRLVRKWDPSERDFRNRELGKAGEAAVLDFERARLARLERPDLARKVRWVAQENGDGAGYDIHSFDAAGRERLIEVKTTAGHSRTPFFITRNERSLADERPDAFRLYRLYDFAETPSLFRLRPPLEQHVTFEGETWRASFG